MMRISFGILPKGKSNAILPIYPGDFTSRRARNGMVPRYIPTDKFLSRLEETLKRTDGLAIIENAGVRRFRFKPQQLRQIALSIGEVLASEKGLASLVKKLAFNPFKPQQRPYPNLPVGSLFLRTVYDPFRASAEDDAIPSGRKPNVVPHSTHGHYDPIHGYEGHFMNPSKGYLMVGILDGPLTKRFKNKDKDAIRFVTDSMELIKQAGYPRPPEGFGDYPNYLSDEQVAEFGIPVDRGNGSIVFHTLPFMHCVGPDSTDGKEGAPYGFLGLSVPDNQLHLHPWTDQRIEYESFPETREAFLRGKKTR